MKKFIFLLSPIIFLCGCGAHVPQHTRMLTVLPSSEDIQLGGDIRRAIFADKTMSVNAQHCDILVSGGRAILSGPVDDAIERRKIAEKAAAVSGVTTVENRLEILDKSIVDSAAPANKTGSSVR